MTSIALVVPRRSALLALATIALGPFLSAQATTSGLERLEQEVRALRRNAGGQLGVAAIHLESGRRFSVDGDEAFPMASTYKVPIATRLLRMVDRGETALTKMITIGPDDLHPGSGTLSALFDDPGVELSLHNLLELMLLISDNSATDMVLRQAGGGTQVTAHMKQIGIDGIRVDRPTLHLIASFQGVPDPAEGRGMTMGYYREARSRVSPDQRRAATGAFDVDPRDTATPVGMVNLLEKIWDGDILSEESTALLLDIMYRCQTGGGRIKGLLPTGTRVANKTGTIGGTTNDVGIIDLPHGAGHVAVAVFIKGSNRQAAQRELAIAQVSRAIYDYYLFAPTDG